MHDQTNLETEAGIVLSDGDLKSIGERLRDLRGKAKLTQGDIAKGSGDASKQPSTFYYSATDPSG